MIQSWLLHSLFLQAKDLAVSLAWRYRARHWAFRREQGGRLMTERGQGQPSIRITRGRYESGDSPAMSR
jgi:hypothetical protein